jgi:glycerol kinase
MVNTEEDIMHIKEGLLTTIAYKLDDTLHYAVEGSIYSSGNIIKWLRDKLQFFETAKESEKHINKNSDSNNVIFLPAFNGLGAPFWNSDIRGGFYGLTQDSTVEDMVTASFNSISFQTKEITTILENYDIHTNKLLVDGGMVQNSKFCQMLADTLNKEINQPDNVESTALGACKVAMIGSKIDIFSLKNTEGKSFKPIEENIEILSKRYGDWKSFVLNILKFN